MERADAAVEWLTLKEAAQRLGVSEDTVRRRVFRRLLPAQQEETPQGYRWLVRLDGAPVAEDAAWRPAAAAESEQAPAESAALVPYGIPPDLQRLVNGLLVPWLDRVEAQAAEVGRLQAQLSTERQARQDAEALLRSLRGSAADLGTNPQRPWWRFW